jgi:hypothetical protein
MLSVIDRVPTCCRRREKIGEDLAAALRAEAGRRASAGEFFGDVTYVSLIARRHTQ